MSKRGYCKTRAQVVSFNRRVVWSVSAETHLGTVQPLAKLLARELTDQLGTPVTLRLDKYPTDLAGRTSAFKALVTGGMDVAAAVATAGLLADDET